MTNEQYSIIADFIGEFDVRSLCNKIVRVCQELVPSEACAIFLKDEKREGFPETITIRAGAGFSDKLIEIPARYEIGGKGITAWAATTGDRVNCKNKEEIHKHPNFLGKYQETQGKKCDTLLIVPIKVNGNIRGILKVENKTPTKDHPETCFTQEEEIILQTFADGIARAINGIDKLTEERISRARDIAMALEGITSLLAKKFDLDDMFNMIVERTQTLLSAGSCSLLMVNEDKESMTMKAGAGFAKPLVGHPEITYYKNGKGITASILRNKRTVNLKTRKEITEYKDPVTKKKVWAGLAEDLQGEKCESYLGIPLMIQNEIVGVLRVENKRKDPPEKYFTGHDEKILQIMANAIIVAIQLKGELEKSEQRRGETYEEIAGLELLTCLEDLNTIIYSFSQNRRIQK